MSKKSTTKPSRQHFLSDVRSLFSSDWFIFPVILLAVLIPSITLGLSYKSLSPLDEHAHFDYVYRVARGELSPKPASLITDETFKEMMCRPSVVYPNANCTVTTSKEKTPVGGINYVLAYGGSYYIPAAFITRIIHAVSQLSWLESVRVTSSLFLALGTALLYLIARRYGASMTAALGGTLLLASCSAVLFQGSTATPDSMSILAGSLAILAPTLHYAWRYRMVVAIIIGIYIALIKPNFVPLGCLTVLMAGVIPGYQDGVLVTIKNVLVNKKTYFAILISFIPLVVAVLWNLFENSRLAPGTRADGNLNDMLRYDGAPIGLIVTYLQGALQPMDIVLMKPSHLLTVIASLTAIVIIGGNILLSLLPHTKETLRIRLLSVLGLIGYVITVIYVPMVLYITYHSTGAQPRYVLPIMALLTVPLIASIRDRVPKLVVLTCGVLSIILATAKLLSVI